MRALHEIQANKGKADCPLKFCLEHSVCSAMHDLILIFMIMVKRKIVIAVDVFISHVVGQIKVENNEL